MNSLIFPLTADSMPPTATSTPASVPTPTPRPGRPRIAWVVLRPWLIASGAIVLAAVVGLALHDLLQTVRYGDVLAAVYATPGEDLAYALIATALSYLALTGYDASALRYAGAEVKRSTVLLTSYVAYALGNSVGLGVLTGGAVRMRLYTEAGLQPTQIAQAIAFNAAAFGLGMTAFGALALLWGAPEVAGILKAPVWLLRGGALLLLAALGGVLVACARMRQLNVFGRWTLKLPPVQLAWRQFAISAADLAASAAALWFLLPQDAVGLPTFVAFYALAVVVSLISHVPGGLGVFEAIILLACGGRAPPEGVLAALVLYRGIYYILPLVLACALLVAHELRSGVAAPVGRMAEHLSPKLLAALSLVAGVWLLVSGVTPASDEAQQLLALKVPLPLIEASHFIGSIAGLGLLLLARGLLHRLDAAWWAALGLSLVAAVLALPKGIALSEAALLSTLALLLVISRRQFDRRSSLFAQRLEPEWLLAVAAVLGACIWVLFLSYQEVEYTNRLWWQFELDGQAPRSLRAITAVVLLGAAIALRHLFQTPAFDVPAPTPADLERAAAVVWKNPTAEACAALMGDKHLLFSPSGKSFVMFGQQGRSWVSLHGPVGEPDEWPELIWNFIELAAQHGGRAAFYQVRPESLPLYLDSGLQAFKLGEYAHVPLPDFSLKGAKRANLRHGVNRAEREGLSFEVLPPYRVHTVLDALRAVSRAWLAEQKTREKGFSVGAFDDDYVQRLPVAVVRRDDRIIAFANLQVTDARDEASVDMMRYAPGAPPGTMDFLFASIMLYLQAEGFQRFGLGMAPMSGMSERRSAPRWQRFGRLLFENGERFYNFRGLRNFKDKFEPVWEARYLAAPGGAAPLLALGDVASLIGGGMRGVVAK